VLIYSKAALFLPERAPAMAARVAHAAVALALLILASAPR
jgi:hypothetical protein